MNPYFSPLLAHMLMDGLSRRVSLKGKLSEPEGVAGTDDAAAAHATPAAGDPHPPAWQGAIPNPAGVNGYRREDRGR